MATMSEDAAGLSSAHSRENNTSPVWSSARTIERVPRRSVLRTTEKSVVFRVRTEEEIISGRKAEKGSPQQKTLYLPSSNTTSSTEDTDVHETMAELYAEMERKKKQLDQEEQTFQRGQERLHSLQQQHASLLRSLEQCKRRRKDRVRIQKMLRGPQAETDDCDNEESGSSSSSDHSRRRSRRDGTKKERKRLRRFQSNVSLRFQLLQSECRRSDMEVEQQMASLRRQYADSCLFGNSLNFEMASNFH